VAVDRRGPLHARPIIGDDVTALAEPCQRGRPEWSGFDAEVHNEARDQFEMLDTLMQWTQNRAFGRQGRPAVFFDLQWAALVALGTAVRS